MHITFLCFTFYAALSWPLLIKLNNSKIDTQKTSVLVTNGTFHNELSLLVNKLASRWRLRTRFLLSVSNRKKRASRLYQWMVVWLDNITHCHLTLNFFRILPHCGWNKFCISFTCIQVLLSRNIQVRCRGEIINLPNLVSGVSWTKHFMSQHKEQL